ncbi:MAG TPA: aldo/keto reductase [Ignavibacteriales bacterium]|nr:aldo/keto reductase [Ignavibacteriales bacterium]
MEYTHLGRSGLKVSRLCLGTMNFGTYTAEDDSFKIMDAALEHGINFFDTANVYGGENKGRTEEIIGRWFQKGHSRREKTVLATKVYGNMSDWPNEGKLSARSIKLACEASLKRLQTDYIDLYQMHHVDRETPWEEIWQAMEQLVQEGKIIYVGSSNFAAWNIVEANYIAEKRNFLGLVSEQSIYSLRNRHIELEVIPACRAMGLGLIPWSPLGGGILSGGVLRRPSEGRRARPALQEAVEKLRPQLEAYERCCQDTEQSLSNIALAWVMNNPVVTAPIIGPRTIEQLEESLKVLHIKLSDEMLEKLDEIWPGPGNQAPEAYAW